MSTFKIFTVSPSCSATFSGVPHSSQHPTRGHHMKQQLPLAKQKSNASRNYTDVVANGCVQKANGTLLGTQTFLKEQASE